MGELENKVLLLLSQGHIVNEIEKKINISEEALADIIINLENESYITLKEKNWTITEKGKGIIKEREEKLKMLKMEYLHGIIDKEVYNKRIMELEEISQFVALKSEIPTSEGILPEKKASINIFCPKCGVENKKDYNYCHLCGAKLKKG